MKIKTSVTISQELLEAIDELLDANQNRSRFLEEAAWEHVARARRAQQNARDLEIIDRRAEYLNDEVKDALSYQVDL